MADLKVQDVLSVPGRFVVTPTDLTAAFPYGGTALGINSDVEYQPGYDYRPILLREKGLAKSVDFVERPGTGTLTFLIRQWDPDFQGIFWPTTSSQTDGSELLTIPGGKSTRLIGGNGVKLLYAPLDESKIAVLFYNAIPALAEPMNLPFGRNVETAYIATFYLMEDGSSRSVAIEKLENLDAVLS